MTRTSDRNRGDGILEGKRTLITGAAGGIGRATAAVFVREGAQVALVDLDPDALGELVDGLVAATARSRTDFPAFAADVTDAAEVERYMTAASGRMGGLDVLFNNAGIEGLVAPLQDYRDDEFDRVMRVNVRGVWLNLKRVVSLMLEAGGGSIVNAASGAALRGLPYVSAYVASKHAVLGLTRSAAVELAGTGIRVNAVCPGPVETRMMRSLEEQRSGQAGVSVEEVRAGYAGPVPMARYGTPEEVAEVVAFLASGRSSYVTGAAVSVDGGGAAA